MERGLELRLHRLTASEACWVSGERIVPNSWIRGLCGVMKGVDERTDECSPMVQPYLKNGEWECVSSHLEG